jgi:hypothetical protein
MKARFAPADFTRGPVLAIRIGMHVNELVILQAIESASSEQALAWSLEAFRPRIGPTVRASPPRTSY